MLNQCQFIGNLGGDPELRYTQGGTAVANFSIACTEKWTDRESGEKQERVEWVRVNAWGRLAEIADQYLHKGKQVFVQGKMRTRKYQDRDGNDRWSTEIEAREIVMLGQRGDRDERAGGGHQADYPAERDASPRGRRRDQGAPARDAAPAQADFDDDIPF